MKALNENIRICFLSVNPSMWTNFNYYLLDMLSQKKWDVYVIGSNTSIFGDKPPIDKFSKLGIKFIGLDINWKINIIKYLFAFLKICRIFISKNFHILYTRGFVMGVIGRIIGKMFRVPVIIHHQDDLLNRNPTFDLFTRKIISIIERYLARLSDMNIFVSSDVMKDAQRIGFEPNKCFLAGIDISENFIDIGQVNINQLRYSMRLKMKRYGIPENANIIGCVGRLVEHKGIKELVNAACRILHNYPDWYMFIKGDGPQYKEIVNIIKDFNLENKILIVRDHFSSDEIKGLFANFDIFILPTKCEGFGMVFLEAMFAGNAIIYPNIPPVNKIVPKHCGFCIENTAVDTIENAIKALIDNRELRIKLSEKAKNYAFSSSFLGERASNKIIDLSLRLINIKLRNKVM